MFYLTRDDGKPSIIPDSPGSDFIVSDWFAIISAVDPPDGCRSFFLVNHLQSAWRTWWSLNNNFCSSCYPADRTFDNTLVVPSLGHCDVNNVQNAFAENNVRVVDHVLITNLSSVVFPDVCYVHQVFNVRATS